MSRKRFSADQWRAWFSEFADSELTVQQFCKRKGTTANTFYNWRRRLRTLSDAAWSDVGSARPANHSGPDSLFVSVELSSSLVEFELAGGVIARVANDPSSLRPLVEVIQTLDTPLARRPS